MQALFKELCEEQVLMHITPGEMKGRKKQRKIESEVIDLRRRMEEATEKNIVLSNREIRLLRYLSLTEDEKEKLKGSYKVAKKLEKLESLSQDKNESTDDEDDEDDDYDEKNEEIDYPSLESCISDNSTYGMIYTSICAIKNLVSGGYKNKEIFFFCSLCTIEISVTNSHRINANG